MFIADQSMAEMETVPPQGPEAQEGRDKGPCEPDGPCLQGLDGPRLHDAQSKGPCHGQRPQTSAKVGPHSLPAQGVSFAPRG